MDSQTDGVYHLEEKHAPDSNIGIKAKDRREDRETVLLFLAVVEVVRTNPPLRMEKKMAQGRIANKVTISLTRDHDII